MYVCMYVCMYVYVGTYSSFITWRSTVLTPGYEDIYSHERDVFRPCAIKVSSRPVFGQYHESLRSVYTLMGHFTVMAVH